MVLWLTSSDSGKCHYCYYNHILKYTLLLDTDNSNRKVAFLAVHGTTVTELCSSVDTYEYE
jgi:hypothetical protein